MASERTLVLNASYEPLKIVSWERAVHLYFQDKVDILENYDRIIRSARVSMAVPSVIRVRSMVRFRTLHGVKFSRSTVFIRDQFRCQYCGDRFPEHELTFDHILPVARGGQKTWENIVTACRPCNFRKGQKTPEEVGFSSPRRVKKPNWPLAILVMLAFPDRVPEKWKNYLFFGNNANEVRKWA